MAEIAKWLDQHYLIELPEDVFEEFTKWKNQQKTFKETKSFLPPVRIKRPRDAITIPRNPVCKEMERPLQLPLRLFATFKDKHIEAILWWVDCEKGQERLPNGQRAYSIVQTIKVPSKTSMERCRGMFTATVTKAVNFLYGNTQSGWTAWKVKHPIQKPLGDFRVKKGGPGFKNHPDFSPAHRDYLMSLCVDSSKSFILSEAVVETMRQQIRKEVVLNWMTSKLTS